jgi:hypothetical protein
MAAEPEKKPSIVWIAFLSGILLFYCAAALGCYLVWQTKPENITPYMLAIAIPFFSLLPFWMISSAVPNLYALRKLKFPITLTLPIVYTVILVLSATLWGNTGNSLVRPNPVLDALSMWFNPVLLLLLIILQFVVLSLAGKVGR